MRNRALIARWTQEHYPEAVSIISLEGKTFLKVMNYELLTEAFGCLLAEIQRIKSEGDFSAAQYLVERYAVKVDASLHAEVLERYRKLKLAPYKGFINPHLTLQKDSRGIVTDVNVRYSEDYAHQMLRYSRKYRTLI